MLHVGRRMHRRCCAGTGIVAEQSACHTVAECLLYGVAEHTAGSLLHTKRRVNDEAQHIHNPFRMCHQYDQCENDISERHKGDDIGSDR